MAARTIGREDQLNAIRAFLDDAHGGGSALVVSGEPGIGKTALWEAGLDESRLRGCRVLESRCAEAETGLSFAVLSDLLTPVLDDVASLLPTPRRHALEVALLLAEPREDAPDARAIGLALLDSLRLLAERTPVVVALDDVQWMDRSSAEVLQIALRRATDVRVRLFATVRDEHEVSLPIDLGRSFPAGALMRISLGPLSVGALRLLLKERLSLTLARPQLARLHEVTGGNPFFALELVGELQRTELHLHAGRLLPVPGSLRELLSRRLARLPAETADLLVTVAALGRATVDVVVAAHPGEGEALEVLESAVREGVIVSEDGRLRFAHPLLASLCYEQASSRRRRAVHRTLAGVVADVEERARHLGLAATGPDMETAAVLEAAARDASARGAPAAAAELLEEARRLTPATAPHDRARRGGDAGWCWFVAGDGGRAQVLLEQALAEAAPGRERVHALARLGRFHFQSGDRRAAVGLYTEALEESGDDPALGAEVHEGLAWSVHLLRENAPLAAHHARAAIELAAEAGDVGVLADALVVLAQSEFFMGGGLPSPAMERAFAVQSDPTEVRVLRRPDQHWAMMLLCADELDEARSIMLAVRELAVEGGDETALPWILMRLAHLELLAGNWAQAREHADGGLEIALEAGQKPLQADLLCTRALLAAHRGDAGLARTLGEEGLDQARRLGTGIGVRIAPWALGLLELSLGDAEAARTRLEPLRRDSERARIVDPGDNRYLPDLIEALVLLGRLDEAGEVLAGYERIARSVGRASALAAAGRCRGLLSAAHGELEDALTELAVAVAAHRRVPIPFEWARTLLALGSLQRQLRRRKAARETLQQALAVFEQLGSELWAVRARSELQRIGGRTASRDELTPAERRIAELVAEGKSNREVAATLAVSVHTVEAALTQVYRKLGVRSRTELARKFAGAGLSKL
jgi:DNA-binding CsgD family transcriptional regulator